MGRGSIAAIAAAAVVGMAPAAGAAPRVAVTYTDTFTSRTPGAATGRNVADSFTNADDPSAKPPRLVHFHLQLPAGARFNTAAVARCTASDAELMASGRAACPAASKVGGEVFTGDTGFPGPGRTITADIAFLNERDGIVLVSQDRSTGARVVSHGRVGAETEDIDLPMLPGTPPDGGVDKSEDAHFPLAVGAGGGYLTTPPTCPPGGFWPLRATYTFADGSQQTLESRSPCDASAAHRPSGARLVFFHRQHADTGRAGSLRIRSTAAGTAVLVVKRRGLEVARRSLRLGAGRLRVALPRLRPGSYRLTVAVTTPGGGRFSRGATLVVR